MNNTIQQVKDLYEFLNRADYSTSSEKFTFRDDIEGIQEYFDQQKIEYEKIDKIIQVERNSLNINVFVDDEEFKTKSKLRDFDRSILILNISRNSRLFLVGGKKYYLGFEADNNFFFENCKAYRELVDFFYENARTEKNSSDLIDFYDRDQNLAFFTSLEFNRKIVIPFNQKIPDFPEKQDLLCIVNKLKSIFNENNKYYPIFIKNEIIEQLLNVKENERAKKLLLNLEYILNNADRNFQVYVNGLSIRKVKADYKEYKHKYFSELSDLLSKIGTAIFGLPITIIGAVFTISELSESTQGLIIVFIVIIILSILISILLQYYNSDLTYLKYSTELDYSKFLSNKFFEDYPEEKKDFHDIKIKLDSKITSLKYFLYLLFVISQVFNILLFSLILNNLDIIPFYIYANGFFFLIVYSIIFYAYLYRK